MKKLQNVDASSIFNDLEDLVEQTLKMEAKVVKRLPDFTIQSYFVGEVLRVDIIPSPNLPT